MYKLKVLLLCLSLVMGLTLLAPATAWADEARYGGTMRVALSTSPPFLDWHQTTAGATEAIAVHMLETVVSFDAEFDFIPQLAREWSVSDDGMNWTFDLRRGVVFHNGKEMTAADVKASIERFRRIAERGGDFAAVDAIETPDPYTVVLRLSERADMLTALSTTVNGVGIYPAEVIDRFGDDVIPAEGIIGTGPYQLAQWTEEQVMMERFDDYVADTSFEATGYGGHRKAYLDRVIFNYVPEASSRIAGLETGEYHLVTELPFPEADRLDQNPDIVLRPFSPYFKPLYFVNATKWPTSDQRIRQALRLAADMDEVLNFVAHGREEFYDANGSVFFIDQSRWFTTEGLDDYNPVDRTRAQALMDEAGYDGAEVVIVTTRDLDWIYREALALYDQWSTVGFNVKLAVYPWAAFVNNIQINTDMNVWTTGLGFPVDPRANAYVYDPLSGHNESLVMGSAETNPVIAEEGFISDAARRIHELMVEERNTDDDERRFEIWKEIQIQLLEDPFLAIIGDYKSLQAHRANVQGYQAFKRETFWNVWLED